MSEKSFKIERDPDHPDHVWETTETDDKKVIVEKERGWLQDDVLSREEIKKK